METSVARRRRGSTLPTLEQLEDRSLLSPIVEYPVLPGFGVPLAITAGPDGSLWFIQASFGLDTVNSSFIGRMTTSGSVTEFPIPGMGAEGPAGGLELTAGPDGGVWYTELGGTKVARISPDGQVTEFSLPNNSGKAFGLPGLGGITAGPDGDLWFTAAAQSPNEALIEKITPTGTVTQFIIPTANATPMQITVGPDGNLWFTEPDSNKIGRITVTGSIVEYQVPPPGTTSPTSGLGAITAGPDGNLWFVESTSNEIGRITPEGIITQFTIPTANSDPTGISSGPDGNVWFTEQRGNKIGRISPDGTITELTIPTANSNPTSITAGPDGNLWFTEELQPLPGPPAKEGGQIGEVVLGLPPTPNGRFVNSLYVNLLHRPADLTGLASWTAFMSQGETRAQVVQGFENSLEYRQDVVEHVYSIFLHRAADPGGLAGWVRFLEAGGTTEQLEALIAGSSEYFQTRAGATNDGFLNALYQDTLNRTVDPSGRAAFDQALAAGMTRTQVASIVLSSKEYEGDFVNVAYKQFLNRSPDPGGFAGWVADLQAGMTEEQFLVKILSSDEYFAQA
jgi:streptogramin lyase